MIKAACVEVGWVKRSLYHQWFFITLWLTFGSIIGCTRYDWQAKDIKQVQRQFHLPEGARVLLLDSYPKEPGWFGREGLRISATVGFSEEEFKHYLTGLNDRGIWKPVSFLEYSPSGADEYSEEALLWKKLPFPHELKRLREVRDLPDLQQGKYYCSTIVSVQDGSLKHNPAAFKWKNLGRACSELADSDNPTIVAVGMLDYHQQLLHVLIKFGG